MKYRVIGWCHFDDDIEEGVWSDAVDLAIIQAIREENLWFTGTDHQNQPRCTPVLNDGKKRTFGERGWGGLMAMAHSEEGNYSYTDFAWAFVEDYEIIYPEPHREVTAESLASDIRVEDARDIREEFVFEVSRAVLESTIGTGIFHFYYGDEYQTLSAGDRLTLISEGESSSYEILGYEHGFDKGTGDSPDPIYTDELFRLMHHREYAEWARKIYSDGNGKRTLSVKIS